MKCMYLTYRILFRMCPHLGLWQVLPAEASEQNCNLTGPALRPEKCDQRKREKAPKWDISNAQRKVSSNSSQEPCLEGSLFTTGQPWWFQTPFLRENKDNKSTKRQWQDKKHYVFTHEVSKDSFFKEFLSGFPSSFQVSSAFAVQVCVALGGDKTLQY